MKIRFVSSNEQTIQEVCEMLTPSGIQVLPRSVGLEEPRTADSQRLVSDQLLTAFKLIGKPLFVEHSCLKVRSLNDFPAGLTRLFWDQLLAERFAGIIGHLDDPRATASTLIGYCDGHKRYFFEASLEGRVAQTPAGDERDWDCIFIPDGEERTLAELPIGERQRISMRKQALDAFTTFLRQQR